MTTVDIFTVTLLMCCYLCRQASLWPEWWTRLRSTFSKHANSLLERSRRKQIQKCLFQ